MDFCSPDPFSRQRARVDPFPDLDPWLSSQECADDGDDSDEFDSDDEREPDDNDDLINASGAAAPKPVFGGSSSGGGATSAVAWSIDDLAQLVRLIS